ncbi:hypothetical protein CSKR_104664 [Clonorchis sinensis]|uniref:Uncharacterized protein n=1 Tax=Clonorchis sinensis TaxID=79923 RepID=A0A419PLY6_CLOSI|nr:hypothetical protein CSKR_104664 [Clonorchis sinensis]
MLHFLTCISEWILNLVELAPHKVIQNTSAAQSATQFTGVQLDAIETELSVYGHPKLLIACRSFEMYLPILAMLWNLGSSGALIECWSVRRAWQLDCKRFINNRSDVSAGLTHLTMSTRLVMKRLQSNCQTRRTDQQSVFIDTFKGHP